MLRNSLSFLLFFVMSMATGHAVFATVDAPAFDVSPDKEWHIIFNADVDTASVTPTSVYVTNGSTPVPVTLTVAGDTVTVTPHTPYTNGQTYTLIVTPDVAGVVNGERLTLNTAIEKPFTITGGYVVGTAMSDGTFALRDTYATFAEADATRTATESIQYDGKFLKIPTGIAATHPSRVTEFFTAPTLLGREQYGGVEKDTELVYVDSTEQAVAVQVAGQTMYMKQQDTTLIPSAWMTGQSYYYVTNGLLWHAVYRPHKGMYDGAYQIGNAPSFLTAGQRYYSTDGVNFVDAQQRFVGESFAYFQYVSPRTPTTYTAAQLNDIIYTQLLQREQSGAAQYQHATTESPLLGLGDTLKDIEAEVDVNALFILALAIHESNYGMSCHAKHYHNLFGLHVTDGNAVCTVPADTTNVKYFETVGDNIRAFISRITDYYINPNAMSDYRYNGAALGNKMIGMNVRYASDPYWGAKTAGHMFRLDQVLGGQDYEAYTLGITTQRAVSVRKMPTVSAERAYQYNIAGSIKRFDRMPLTFSQTVAPNDWHRLVSELANGDDVYTAPDNARIVQTH